MAVAEIRPDWTIGTLTLTSGSKNFTTAGSALQTAAIQAGDSIITESGLVLIIADITGQNAGTLMEPCPAGAAGMGQPLRVRFQPDGSRYNGATADLVQLLGSGNVYEFAGLDGTGGGVPVFTGAGTMKLGNYVADPNGSLGKLAGLPDVGTLGLTLLPLVNGTSTQYVQGDGTLQEKAGLPVSTAMQAALDQKFDKSGGNVSGNITALSSIVGAYYPLGSGAQYASGFKINLGNDIHFLSLIENMPGTSLSGILQLSSPLGLRNWIYGSDGGFTANGPINGSVKNFEIDHTVDPDNYDLRHCATEAPELLVEYRGTTPLVNGRATVNVEEYYGVKPNTFANLWADAWVTALQNQDSFDRLRPSRVSGAAFDIVCEDENSNDLVTWVVMARRNDPYVRWDGCKVTDIDGKLIIEFEKETL